MFQRKCCKNVQHVIYIRNTYKHVNSVKHEEKQVLIFIQLTRNTYERRTYQHIGKF